MPPNKKRGKLMKKNLVIVAHPDDETIWMGGTLLQNQNDNWTIISLCRKNDPDREPKFNKVCKTLKARCIIADLDDERLAPLPIKKIAEKIKSLLPAKKYDNVYTHGLNGEYGHIRHKEIHKAVKKLVKDKSLSCKNLLSFSYSKSNKTVPQISKLKIPIPSKKSDKYVKLTEDNFKKKLSIMKDMYGFNIKSFEVLSCNKIEAFKILQ